MSHTHTYGGIVGFVAALFLLFANGAIANEGKQGKHHAMGMEYGESYGGAYEGMKGHHGEIRGHGKKQGHGKKHGQYGTHGDAHHHAFSLHQLKKKLHLTNAQVDALRPIEADYKKAVIRKKADVRIAEIDLGLLIDSPKIGRAHV